MRRTTGPVLVFVVDGRAYWRAPGRSSQRYRVAVPRIVIETAPRVSVGDARALGWLP